MLAALSENTVGNSRGLVGEWGLSIYIEVNGMKILFDTGECGGLLNNADVLGINLKSVEALVLSHGHYDHTGGMIEEPEHAWTLYVREPGDLSGTRWQKSWRVG